MTATFDSWDIRTLREAKEYRDANPDPRFAEADAALDAQYEAAVAQRLHPDAVEVPDEAPAVRRPSTGASSHRVDPPTEKQLSFLRSLVERKNLDPAQYSPTSKRQASDMIDKAKAAREGTAPAAPAAKPAPRPATERQVEFVTDLWMTREHAAQDSEIPDDMSFEDASAFIEHLLACPKRARATHPSGHGIREGRYAFADAEGVHHFYRVTRTGVIKIVAGPAEHTYTGKLNEALEAIKADPKSAAALYGQQIGHCGRCGLQLTDEDSRALGLGPICAGKSEW